MRNRILLALIIILILAASILLSMKLAQKPEITVAPPAVNIVYVDTITVKRGTYNPQVKTFGKIMAAAQVSLVPEVSGKVISVSSAFTPGNTVKKNQVLITIDPTNYKAQLVTAQSQYDQALASYKQALGNTKQAKTEMKYYQNSTGRKINDNYLVLKKPELDRAKATLKQALSNLKVAQHNLDLTKVRAPFNGVIQNTNVALGSYVNPQTSITDIVNINSYWVKASLPIGSLKEINLTESSKATVILSDNRGTRKARFFKLLKYLDDKSQFIGVLFTVSDPMAIKNKKLPILILGNYVDLTIIGNQLTNVFKLPLHVINSKNQVYINQNGKLKIVNINIEFQNNDYAFVTGLNNNDQVITSDLAIVADGMPIKVN